MLDLSELHSQQVLVLHGRQDFLYYDKTNHCCGDMCFLKFRINKNFQFGVDCGVFTLKL